VIPLPKGINLEKVEATFKNGLLTVKLPKTEEAQSKGKKIPITTG
jgi:HSP20 family protein